MCGRAYSTYTDEELRLRYLNEKGKRGSLGELNPNYNLCPTQKAPVVIWKDGKPSIQWMRWGLVPFWAKDVKSADKYSLINAKAEEIEKKRSYADAFKSRHCIVPVSGFFEWKRIENSKTKQPYAIRLKESPILSMAGIWDHWESEGGEVVDSFSVITTAANSFMAKIHDRMPVILPKQAEMDWLQTGADKELLNPCPSEWLEAYPVSTLVNSPRNNSEAVIASYGPRHRRL